MRQILSQHKFEIFLILVFVTLYTLAASLVSLHRFWQYNAFWYDFGIFDETIWKWSKFELPIIPNLNPPQGLMVWADHFNPSAAILALFYWITDKPEITFIAQAIFVGLSALVAYFIALKIVKNALVRVSLIVSFLGFVGMQNALFTDVHNIVFALFPLMLTIWAIYEKKWILYWLFLAFTLGFQENMAAIGAGLGLFLMLKNDRNIKVGIFTLLVSLLYGILTLKVLIPFLKGGDYSYAPMLPKVWSEWITRFFIPAELKLKTILSSFATFGFLPLGSIAAFPLIFEHFFERFVLNTIASRWDLGFHYNALLSPIMFIASLEVIRRIQNNKFMKKILPAWAVLTILVVIFLHRFYLHGPLQLSLNPAFYKHTKNMEFLDDFVTQIPTEGLIMTQNDIAAHFTHSNTVLLSKNYKKIKPDVVAIILREGQNANNFYPVNPLELDDLVKSLSEDPNYTKKSITNDQVLFIRQ